MAPYRSSGYFGIPGKPHISQHKWFVQSGMGQKSSNKWVRPTALIIQDNRGRANLSKAQHLTTGGSRTSWKRHLPGETDNLDPTRRAIAEKSTTLSTNHPNKVSVENNLNHKWIRTANEPCLPPLPTTGDCVSEDELAVAKCQTVTTAEIVNHNQIVVEGTDEINSGETAAVVVVDTGKQAKTEPKSLYAQNNQLAWKRLGNNKLILRCAESKIPHTDNRATDAVKSPPSIANESTNKGSPQLGNQQSLVPSALLMKIGRNKLTVHRPALTNYHVSAAQLVAKRKPEPDPSQLRQAKRIRIASNNGEDGHQLSSCPQMTEEGKNNRSETFLTTFAYCQPTTASGNTNRDQRRKNRAHAAKSNALVRVPATDETRVCPWFARGMPCENEGCLLRHDVPPEATQPTCFFFSTQNGMCLREDCPFRHVKSTTTVPCPRFEKMGYCTDGRCTLAHVRHKSKTLTMTTKPKEGTVPHAEPELVFYDDSICPIMK